MYINTKMYILLLVFCMSVTGLVHADSCRPAPKPEIENFFYHLPILETNRLILRPFTLEDAEDLFETHRDPEVVKYLPFDADTSVEDTRARIQRYLDRAARGESTFWAVVLKDTGKVIGRCGFWRVDRSNAWGEIIRIIHKDYWGYGIGTEVLYALCRYGFLTIGLNKIFTYTYVENVASLRTYEKIGFRRVGLLKELLYYKGAYWDRVAYEMLAKDFRERYGEISLYSVTIHE